MGGLCHAAGNVNCEMVSKGGGVARECGGGYNQRRCSVEVVSLMLRCQTSGFDRLTTNGLIPRIVRPELAGGQLCTKQHL